MKIKSLFISLVLLLVNDIVNAQIVNIPDVNFKNALVNENVVDIDGDGIGDDDVDTNDDGEIQVSEAEAVLRLNVSGGQIASLDGIESFTNLVELYCWVNNLTSLNVTNSPNLTVLWFGQNLITEVDLTQNTNLVEIFCNASPLANIDVTHNPNLSKLWLNANELTSLDLSQNPNLTLLNCLANQLTSLDVTQNPNLIELYVRNNLLTSLDVSQNKQLRFLYCNNNTISNLDISLNPNVEVLHCSGNELVSLNLKNGNNQIIERMWAYDNPNLECIQIDDDSDVYPICDIPNLMGWCKDQTAEYSEFCVLGTEDFMFSELILYPNPATNILSIQTEQYIENMRIYSAQGVLVKEIHQSKQLDVSLLSEGVYFVEITSNGKSFTKRFIKY